MLGNTLSLASDGAHEDDASADLHSLIRLLGDEELATGVDAHDTVILFLLDIFEVAERDHARIGAANVELAERGNNLVHEPSRLLGVCNVGFDRNGIGTASHCLAHFLDLLDEFFGGFRAVCIVYSHLRSSSGKLKSHFPADTTSCPFVNKCSWIH